MSSFLIWLKIKIKKWVFDLVQKIIRIFFMCSLYLFMFVSIGVCCGKNKKNVKRKKHSIIITANYISLVWSKSILSDSQFRLIGIWNTRSVTLGSPLDTETSAPSRCFSENTCRDEYCTVGDLNACMWAECQRMEIKLIKEGKYSSVKIGITLQIVFCQETWISIIR